MDVTEQHYYAMEKGTRSLSPAYLSKLSDFYGVSTDYIMGRSESSGVILDSEEFPPDVKVMMRDAKELTPEQRDIVHKLIKEIKQSRHK